ncbi:MAG: glycogen/starch synthase, partial [Clostridia bacterium]|nr:glycogen/starch synthase [Clostridia bacterium]
MKILFAASEAAPFLKSGGLGDVLEALPAALSEREGCEVSLMLP